MIKELLINYRENKDGSINYGKFIVGKNNVIKILEHEPRCEGDKYYFDIYFKDSKTRIINPENAEYNEELEKQIGGLRNYVRL